MIKNTLLICIVALLSPLVQSQTCNDAIVRVAPDSRYTPNNDGTVTDEVTKLIWMRCGIGQTWNSATTTCDGVLTGMYWKNALTIGRDNVFAGHSDWRLPNAKELTSITEQACINPSINETMFPNTASELYYTSTEAHTSNIYDVWHVHFNQGQLWNEWHNRGLYVRLVRDVN